MAMLKEKNILYKNKIKTILKNTNKRTTKKKGKFKTNI